MMFRFLVFCLMAVLVSGQEVHNNTFIFGVTGPQNCTSDVYLYMTSLQQPEVNVTVRLPRRPDVDMINTTAIYGQWTNVTLPPHVRLKETFITNQGIEIQATSAISVYVVEPVQCGGQSIRILPRYALGTHYIMHSPYNGTTSTSTVSVTGTKDHTQVTVTLSPGNNNDHGTGTMSFNNATYHAGQTFHAKLHAYQTMLLVYESAIWRIDIRSSDHVAVLCVQDSDDDSVVHKASQSVPVSRWGKEFISFPMSNRGDTIRITAAEDDTTVLVVKRSQTSSFSVSSRLPVAMELPVGDVITIRSDKPLVVLQYPEGDCPSPTDCADGKTMVVPPVGEVTSRYVLMPLEHDEGSAVSVNLVVDSQQRDVAFFRDVPLSKHDKDVLNVTLYGVSGRFSLYRLSLLASSGALHHRGDGLLLMSLTSPFVHYQPPLDNNNNNNSHDNNSYNRDTATTTIDSRNNDGPGVGNGADFGDDVTPLASAGGFSVTGYLRITTNALDASSELLGSSFDPEPTASAGWSPAPMTSSYHDRPETAASPMKSAAKADNHLNDILKYEWKSASDVKAGDGVESPLRPSGMPFVVKEIKTREEINFHEAESRGIRQSDNDDAPGLDVTVIAVIVSLASAVILVIVVVFGFLMAEFICRRDAWALPRVPLRLGRVAQNRRRIGDCGPLIKENLEMFPRDDDDHMVTP